MILLEKVCEVWFVPAISHPWTSGVKWNERWQQSPARLSLGRGLSQAVWEGHTMTDEATLSLGTQTQWWSVLCPEYPCRCTNMQKYAVNTDTYCFKLLHSCSNSISSAHAQEIVHACLPGPDSQHHHLFAISLFSLLFQILTLLDLQD